MYNPEINEIQGVYRIKIDTPFPVGYVCVYIFKIDDSYVMFDAGLKSISDDVSTINTIGFIESLRFIRKKERLMAAI